MKKPAKKSARKPAKPRKPDTHVRLRLDAVLILKEPGGGLPPGLMEVDINEFVVSAVLNHYKLKLWVEKARAAGAKKLGEVPEPTDEEIDAACPFGAVAGGAGINWSVARPPK